MTTEAGQNLRSVGYSNRRFRARTEAVPRRVRRRSADRQDRKGLGRRWRRCAAQPRPSQSVPMLRRARRRIACSRRAANCPTLRNSSATSIRSTPTSGSRRTLPRTNIRSRRTISAGASSACSTWRRTRIPIMCRLRMPNGILKAAQFAGVADLAERYGGGYTHVTTRANLQIREIEAKNAVAMIEAIQDLGLCSRGSGADNIRNVTGTPTAGIDPQELIDTRPYAREWHFHILNDRSLYGLPRKFNVAFDGAGIIPVLEDTNDIGFQAVAVKDGFGLAAGVWFRLCLGGLTGHHRFRRRHWCAGEAGGRHDGRRHGCARVHRPRRPHRSHQGAAQICARQNGRRQVPRPHGRKTWPQARPCRPQCACAASVVCPYGAYRHPRRRSRTASTGSVSWCRSAG